MAVYITLECSWCGKSFDRLAKRVREKAAKNVYCTPDCRLNGKKRASLDFWSLVDIRGENDCWPWKAGIDKKGYGFFEENGKHIIAHRRAYELAVGPIDNGIGYHGTVIRHKCDSGFCCNPNHLIPGTQTDNMVDMVTRRRMKLKLTEDQVRAIREDPRPQSEISKEHGISQVTVSNIKTRTRWKHLS